MENKHLKEQKYFRAQKRVKAIKGFYIHLLVYLGVNLFIFLAKIIDGEGWAVFSNWESYGTTFFWGIGIAFHAFSVFGLGFILGNDWEERKIKEIMDREKKQYWE